MPVISLIPFKKQSPAPAGDVIVSEPLSVVTFRKDLSGSTTFDYVKMRGTSDLTATDAESNTYVFHHRSGANSYITKNGVKLYEGDLTDQIFKPALPLTTTDTGTNKPYVGTVSVPSTLTNLKQLATNNVPSVAPSVGNTFNVICNAGTTYSHEGSMTSTDGDTLVIKDYNHITYNGTDYSVNVNGDCIALPRAFTIATNTIPSTETDNYKFWNI